MLLTKVITPQMIDTQLKEFCDKCTDLGYDNNNSINTMKYQWCLDFGGTWHYVSDGYGNIVSLAGCHPLPEVNDKAWRVMFRGVQLPGNYGFGLSKYHMNALTWRLILPLQLEYCNTDEIYITTNIKHDASGKMNKTHRLFKNLDKLGMVKHYKDMELYNTEQSVWKLDIEKYKEVRSDVV